MHGVIHEFILSPAIDGSMTFVAVHLFVRITDINGMGIRLLGQNSDFILLLHLFFYD
jgi:hypothetical protein